MRRDSARFTAVMIAATTFGLWMSGSTARACSSPPPAPPPPQIIHVGGDDFTLRLQGFTTFGAPVGENCACGLTLDGLSISEAVFVEAGTNTPVPGFDDWTPDGDVTGELDVASSTGVWQGFSTEVSVAVPPGLVMDVVFTVQASRGRDVARALPDTLVGSGQWDPVSATFPDPAHFAIVAPALPAPVTLALASAVQSGFYECRDPAEPLPPLSPRSALPPLSAAPARSPISRGQDTLLYVVNEDTARSLCATIVVLDGNENVVACGALPLTPEDVDIINLCQILPGGMPEAGVVEVVTTLWDPDSGITCPVDPQQPQFRQGAYSWMKDVVYEGGQGDPVDPFTARRILSSSRTVLRLTPTEIADPFIVLGKCWELGTEPERFPPALYLNDTHDPSQETMP